MRDPNAVHHIGEAIQHVVCQGNVGAGRVGDVGQVGHLVVRVSGGALGGCPTAGQAVVGVVLVDESHVVGRVQFIGDTAELVINPGGGLAFAVDQVGQVAGGVVGEGVGGDGRIDLVGFVAERVVGITDDVGFERGELGSDRDLTPISPA